MRTDLYRDPKVCMIADHLLDDDSDLARYVNQNCQRNMTVTRNVMRNVTVGALVTLWGVTRHRGKRDGDDLVIRSATINIIDDIVDLPGFGNALEAVGWAYETDEGVIFPRFFEEMNTDPNEDAKAKNAARQRKYREKSNALRNVTVTSQCRAREEKEKEKSITISEALSEPERETSSTLDLRALEKEILDFWNNSEAQPKVRKLSPDRLKKLRTRLKDCDWPWREAIDKLPIYNDERFTWQPDFDWLIACDKNAYSLAEGKFDRHKATKRDPLEELV